MDICFRAFSAEVVKIAAEKSKGYPAAVLAALPFAVGSSVAEVPKGALDKAIEQSIAGKEKQKAVKATGTALRRGVGRGVGRLGAGILTAPVFLSGIEDIKEGRTKEERNRGYAKVLASGLGYAAGKGGIEGVVEHGISRKALGTAGRIAGVRGALGIGSAALTAAAVAKSLRTTKKEEGKKPSWTKRYVLPVATGAGIGAVKGGIESVIAKKIKPGQILKPKNLRAVLGAGAGRMASTAVGALALSELARRMLGKKKTAAAREMLPSPYTGRDLRSDVRAEAMLPPPYLGPTTSEIYAEARNQVAGCEVTDLKSQYEAILRRKDAETTPTRRAVVYAMHDELADRGQEVPAPRTRSEVAALRAPTIADTALVTAAVVSPYAVWNLGFGHMEQTEKDAVIRDSLDRLAAHKKIAVREAEKTPLGIPDALFRVEESGKKVIEVGKRQEVGILAHELGHATASPVRRALLQSELAATLKGVAKVPSVLIPIIAVEGTRDSSFTTPEELKARAKFVQNVGYVSALMHSPALAEELISSAKGLQLMSRAGATGGQLGRSAAGLASAFGTHAAPAAAPFIAAAYLRYKASKAEK